MKFFVLCCLVAGAFAVERQSNARAAPALTVNARTVQRLAPPPIQTVNRNGQNPPIWDALRQLTQGGYDLTVEEQFDLIRNAVHGKDYPVNAYVPNSGFQCSSYNQAGYYADVSTPSNCQAFHRCDVNGIDTGYLCPNGTLFNQITLVCDWFFKVDCSQASQFFYYSNSRLYQENANLLDDQLQYEPVYRSGAAAAARINNNFGTQQAAAPQSNINQAANPTGRIFVSGQAASAGAGAAVEETQQEPQSQGGDEVSE